MKLILVAFMLSAVGCGQTVKKQGQAKTTQAAKRKIDCENGKTIMYVSTFPYPLICKDGSWVKDEKRDAENKAYEVEMQANKVKQQARRTRLWNALRTRVITDAEMEEVLSTGMMLVPTKDGGYNDFFQRQAVSVFSFRQGEDTAFNASAAQRAEYVFQGALLLQFRIRAAAAAIRQGSCEGKVDLGDVYYCGQGTTLPKPAAKLCSVTGKVCITGTDLCCDH